jgi:hypothetical protein
MKILHPGNDTRVQSRLSTNDGDLFGSDSLAPGTYGVCIIFPIVMSFEIKIVVSIAIGAT